MSCFYGGRAKRNYLASKSENSIGFLGSAEMLDIYPKPIKFVAPDNPMVKELSLTESMILVSRSGTIGNVAFVSEALKKHIVSEHAIRLIVKDFPGYVYAYLKTDTAQNLLHAEKFGSVILEIEPSSFMGMVIPNPPSYLKKKINDLVVSSYSKRDASNKLIDEATNTLVTALKLPSIEKLEKEAESHSEEVTSFTKRISTINGRLEGNYHNPIISLIIKEITKTSKPMRLRDKYLTDEIILPGRFKRVYVEKGNGKTFIGGKEIGQLNPENKKYLSLIHHTDRIQKELSLKEGMILVTCSGTIGRTSVVPKHWEKWTVNQHVLRVVGKEDFIGLIYIWLNSDYGQKLITGKTYGSVVNEITDKHLGDVCIPVPNDLTIVALLNDYIRNANKLRYEAYIEEQEAIKIMDRDVLGL